MPTNDMADGTVSGLLEFLSSAAAAGLNPATVAGWRSTFTSVTTALHIDSATLVEDLDVESVMDRFLAVKGRLFRSGTAYRRRMCALTRAYLGWLDGGDIAPEPADSVPGPVARLSERNGVTTVVEFAIRPDLVVALELPVTLSPSVGRRLHALIDSLVIDAGDGAGVEPAEQVTAGRVGQIGADAGTTDRGGPQAPL